MTPPPATTTFTRRGRLTGTLRQSVASPGPNVARQASPPLPVEMDTQAYEALYYRARLILGDSLSRPPRRT
jgi:hypothetical protein